MFSRSQKVGLRAELWVFNQLVARGYKPKLNEDFNAECCDILLDGLTIEVKSANKTFRYRRGTKGNLIRYPRWQWWITDTRPTDREWALILIAQDGRQMFPFVIPGSLVGNRSQVQITRHPDLYSGWMAEYLNRWEMIDFLSQEAYLNDGPLFHQWLAEEA